jgi:hypothetical protein
MVDSLKGIYDHLKENLKVLFRFIPKIAYKTSLNTRNLSKSDELFFFWGVIELDQIFKNPWKNILL